MIIVYLFISLATSIIGAISGIGGGIIIRPVLDITANFDVRVIGFLSGNTVLAMTVAALLRNRKSEVNVDRYVALPLASGAILGGLGGKGLFDFFRFLADNQGSIGAVQSIILSILTLAVLIFTFSKSRIKSYSIRNRPFCLLLGLLMGGLASFLGIGGGPINLALLYLCFSMDSRTAALNSLFIIFFSQLANLIYTILSGNIPAFPPEILVLMILGGISGGILGLQISQRISERQIDRLFATLMVLIIGISLFNFLRYLSVL